MKTIETLYEEIKAEGEKNVKKADRFLDALLLLEKSINKAVETMKAVKEELTRPLSDQEKAERDGGTL